MTNNIYRHFALLAFIIFWSASLIMVRKWWGGSRQVTFSLHAARNKTTQKLFAITVAIETVLYLLFAFKWFIPFYGMPFIFGVLIALTTLGHLIAGVIPETKGTSKWVHRKASYGSIILFIPEFLIIGLMHSLPIFVRFVAAAFLLTIFWAWYLYLFKLGRREDIVYQGLYISTLPIVLILAAYIH